MKKLYIVGTGVGGLITMTVQALNFLRLCDTVYASSRIAEQLSDARPDIQVRTVSEIYAALNESSAESVMVLASGDVGFYSISQGLIEQYSDQYEIIAVNGLSSMQYFCAKLCVSYDDVVTVSVHGRETELAGYASYHKKVFVLTGGKYKAHDVCRYLVEIGLGEVAVSVGENLSLKNERIITATAQEIAKLVFDDLAVMLICNDLAVDCNLPVKDYSLVRGQVPMTKEEVRWLSVSKLEVLPEHVVYDIGAGTGSVAIELARRASHGIVYALEKEDQAVDLIEQNRKILGAYNITVVHKKAPDGLDQLPAPDRVFIGGSSGNMGDILDGVLEKNPYVRVVINAVTLETINQAVALLHERFDDVDVAMVNISKSKKLGRYNLMTAQNPVYILTGGTTDEHD